MPKIFIGKEEYNVKWDNYGRAQVQASSEKATWYRLKAYVVAHEDERTIILPIKAKRSSYGEGLAFLGGLPNLIGGNVEQKHGTVKSALDNEMLEETWASYETSSEYQLLDMIWDDDNSTCFAIFSCFVKKKDGRKPKEEESSWLENTGDCYKLDLTKLSKHGKELDKVPNKQRIRQWILTLYEKAKGNDYQGFEKSEDEFLKTAHTIELLATYCEKLLINIEKKENDRLNDRLAALQHCLTIVLIVLFTVGRFIVAWS
jgi:hypothetical protein